MTYYYTIFLKFYYLYFVYRFLIDLRLLLRMRLLDFVFLFFLYFLPPEILENLEKPGNNWLSMLSICLSQLSVFVVVGVANVVSSMGLFIIFCISFLFTLINSVLSLSINSLNTGPFGIFPPGIVFSL